MSDLPTRTIKAGFPVSRVGERAAELIEMPLMSVVLWAVILCVVILFGRKVPAAGALMLPVWHG
jgi:hypothetical protein